VEEKHKKGTALTEAWGTLADMNGKIYRTEEDACVAKEAAEQARDEATQAKQEATKVKEDKKAAEDNMVLLIEHIRKLKIELAASKEINAGIKAELLDQAVVQGITEENEREAHKELKKEQALSRSLSDDIECLKRALREKEDTIL